MGTNLTIGEQVREWRTGAGMSGAALAVSLGISRGKVSELENGTFQPGVKVAVRLEALSGGRIDAGALNPDVAAAREAISKGAAALPVRWLPAGGGPVAEDDARRVIICDLCAKPVVTEAATPCLAPDCPFSGRLAA